MEILRPAGQDGHGAAGGDGPSGAPSIGSSLENLVDASQSVMTNRIELALLEARELLVRSLRDVAWMSLVVLLATAGWFAAIAGGVLFLLPDASRVVHLAVFAMLNGGCAAALLVLVMRPVWPGQPHARRQGAVASPAPAHELPIEGRRGRRND